MTAYGLLMLVVSGCLFTLTLMLVASPLLLVSRARKLMNECHEYYWISTLGIGAIAVAAFWIHRDYQSGEAQRNLYGFGKIAPFLVALIWFATPSDPNKQ